ncbi:MAG: DUF6763 family protein [Sulfurifustis sp.]
MPMEEEPVVGAMYEDQDGVAFEVLSFDEDDGTIEVQYEDGEVGEIDIDNWYEMDLQKLKAGAWKDSEEEEEEEEEAPPGKVGRRAPVEDDDEDLDDYDEEDDNDDFDA